jgi:hypothetical protein
VIVVVGSPIARPVGGGIAAGGLAAGIGRAAVARGAAVQLVGRVGEDPAGDLVLLDLAAHGVGHVALLREPGRPTPAAAPPRGESPSPDEPALGEALIDGDDGRPADQPPADGAEPALEPAGLSVDGGDLELALRYVPDYRVLIVAADLDPSSLEAVVAAAGWSGAHLVALLGEGDSSAALPDDATVLVRPPDDPDGDFAAMVGAYAAALDAGDEPRAAFETAQRSGGWAAVAD